MLPKKGSRIENRGQGLKNIKYKCNILLKFEHSVLHSPLDSQCEEFAAVMFCLCHLVRCVRSPCDISFAFVQITTRVYGVKTHFTVKFKKNIELSPHSPTISLETTSKMVIKRFSE